MSTRHIMKKQTFDKFIILLLILSPVIDFVSFKFLEHSIGTIIKAIFFLIIIIYLCKSDINKKTMTLFLIYVFLAISYELIYTSNSIFVEFLNVTKTFYLPIMICFFNKYENEKINDKLLVIIYLIYISLMLILNSLFDSHNNELSAIVIGLLPVVLNYVINSKSYILKILIYVETLLLLIFISTKTLYLGIILLVIYFAFKSIKKALYLEKKKVFKYILMIVLFALLMIIITPKLQVYDSVKEKINTSNDFINDVVFSNRLNKVNEISKQYLNTDKLTIMYGIHDDLNSGIDVIDIIFNYGLFGFSVWLIIMVYIIKKQRLRSEYKLSFILFLILSVFSGNILIRPMVTLYISMLFILNKNAVKLNKKKILLVSNMYPSNKYKHYGSFVKNTKELLEENNFIVDKSVMYKQDNIIGKIFSYLKLYIGTILKGIFNNYDYIYVHFISHSSFSAVFLKLTSKDIKLVLNAHGNDVVIDMPSDNKNVKRSKKYIKFADKVVVPSSYFKDVIVKEYNVDENKVFIYPSGGVDTDKFVKLDKDECKKNCNLDSKYKYIGYVSRIEKDKGWDTFLKAIKELEKDGKIDDKKFLIVGSGSEENEMNKLIKELDILKYLEIRSLVSQDELVKIYNSLEIFVFPTYRKSESLGLVGLEAMSCETFVIASNNYGPTDYVRDNKNGFYFEPKNEIDLKNKILEYEKLNNEQKKKISKKMRETAVKYDVRNTKDKILEVFR